MIYLFITGRNRETVIPFLTNWPNRAAEQICLIPYRKIHRIRSIQPGLFIFSDIDRLSPGQKIDVEHLAGKLIDRFGGNSVINAPSRVLNRYELLMLLWRNEINHFRPFTLEERDAVTRFPVFIRRADDHSGPRSALIESSIELHRECERLQKVWRFRNRLIIIEYCETRGDDGIFRKYSAFRIGDEIIPGHIIRSEDWVAKDCPSCPMPEEERLYLQENPHREELLRIFRLAGIEYGRIDYGWKDGRIEVWEINTNPILLRERKDYIEAVHPMKEQLVGCLSGAFLAALEKAERAAEKKSPLDLGIPVRNSGSWIHQLDRQLRPIHLRGAFGRKGPRGFDDIPA